MTSGDLLPYEARCREVIMVEVAEAIEKNTNHRSRKLQVAEGVLEVIGAIKAKRLKRRRNENLY